MEAVSSQITDDEILTNAIYCANCVHCVVLKQKVGVGSQFVLRVRCKANQWKKPLGEEKLYKYFTVGRRTMDSCTDYEPMGDLKNFIRDLKKTLPVKDEIYLDELELQD